MPKLRQFEINRWQARVREIFDQAMEKLAAEYPTAEEELAREAEKLAAERLGIATERTKLTEAQELYRDLKTQINELEDTINQQLGNGYSWKAKTVFNSQVKEAKQELALGNEFHQKKEALQKARTSANDKIFMLQDNAKIGELLYEISEKVGVDPAEVEEALGDF